MRYMLVMVTLPAVHTLFCHICFRWIGELTDCPIRILRLSQRHSMQDADSLVPHNFKSTSVDATYFPMSTYLFLYPDIGAYMFARSWKYCWRC